MKRLGFLVAVLLALLLPAGLQAQTLVDSLNITILGNLAAIEIEGPRSGYAGDQLNLTFRALDPEGNKTLALFTWTVVDPTLASWTETSDSTGVLSLLRPGNVRVEVTAEEVTSVQAFIFNAVDGWSKSARLTAIDEVALICAVVFRNQTAIASSNPTCPGSPLETPGQDLDMQLTRTVAISSMFTLEPLPNGE